MNFTYLGITRRAGIGDPMDPGKHKTSRQRCQTT